MIDKRRAAIGETTTSCYALRFLRRFATGILEIGSRSERNVARVARNVATIDKRARGHVGMSDKRRAAIGETTTSCYALRLLRRFATGILEIGSRSERNVARVARNVATIDKRRARLVGMSDKSRAATAIRIETTAGRCGCKRPSRDMVCGRRSKGPAHSSRMTSATAPSGRFAAGFCEPVGVHGLGVLGSPVVWQHLIESWIIVVKAKQRLTQVGPGFHAASMAISRCRCGPG